MAGALPVTLRACGRILVHGYLRLVTAHGLHNTLQLPCRIPVQAPTDSGQALEIMAASGWTRSIVGDFSPGAE